MLTFIDFETKGLNGPITEACAIDESGKIIKHCENNVNFEEFLDGIIQDDNVIIFWHNFMPIYLSIYENKVFNKMKGNFLIFTDFYAIFDGVKQPKYSINQITQILTGRYHKGNAIQDALDLRECYFKMQ